MRIAITGPSGSGKTTLAMELARVLDIPLVMWRLLRRTHVRNRDKIELWNGNFEPGWRESSKYLIWPALKRAFANRREFPHAYAHLNLRRLRSDKDVRDFIQSINL
jgi:thymidylate kinase